MVLRLSRRIAHRGAAHCYLAWAAHRERDRVAREKLTVACDAANIRLENSALARVTEVAQGARHAELISTLGAASEAAQISEEINAAAKAVGAKMLAEFGEAGPEIAILFDRNGRVIARLGNDENLFGDSMSGRPLVDDALSGFVRDDVWFDKNNIFLVAASPVVLTSAAGARYAGALLLGRALNAKSLSKFGDSLGLQVAAFLGPQQIASTSSARLDGITLAPTNHRRTCPTSAVQIARSGDTDLVALSLSLPGESQAKSAYLVFFASRPFEDGLFSTIGKLTRADLKIPWVLLALVGGAFLAALIFGLLLPYFESGRPLRRLQRDALGLVQASAEKFDEARHSGRYGEVARAVNIVIDKLMRETKSARNDLDQLLTGATTGASSVGIASMPAPLPPPVGGADDFSLESISKRYANDDLDLPPPPSAAAQMAAAPPKGAPPALPPPPRPPSTPGSEDPQLRAIYDEYIRTKQSCGESTTGLTYHKFEETIARNRSQLISQTGCIDVKFSVYVKDGKAALRAVPVRA
ncbi:MAG: hypothetical protein IPL79_00790 [Myxococcales bacterium]|nr:hypothetical protein [Myxococcales bacterium]